MLTLQLFEKSWKFLQNTRTCLTNLNTSANLDTFESTHFNFGCEEYMPFIQGFINFTMFGTNEDYGSFRRSYKFYHFAIGVCIFWPRDLIFDFFSSHYRCPRAVVRPGERAPSTPHNCYIHIRGRDVMYRKNWAMYHFYMEANNSLGINYTEIFYNHFGVGKMKKAKPKQPAAQLYFSLHFFISYHCWPVSF